MQEKVSRITNLIEKVLDEQQMTSEEEMDLNAWLEETEHNGLFFQQITDKSVLREKLKTYASADSEAIWKMTLKKINAEEVINLSARKTFKIPHRPLTRWLAAIFN